MFVKSYNTVFGRNALLINNLGEYDLKDTFECGQCFRYEEIICDEHTGYKEYLIPIKNTLVFVGQRKRGELIFYGTNDDEFEEIIRPYFALDSDLSEIKDDIISNTDSDWLKNAAEMAGGIAILKQQPFEALISFIISQNNNIPRIRKIVKKICSEYGVNLYLQKSPNKECPLKKCANPCESICKNCGSCYSFPSAADILENPEKLLSSRPGFRYKYICNAAKSVSDGTVSLEAISSRGSYDYTSSELKKIKGVGEKIASCVALFAFSNLDAFPVDVWIKRASELYFEGKLNPSSLGKYAGFAQQYIFHKIRNIENEKKN